LTPELLAERAGVMSGLDADGDGVLSKEEIAAAMVVQPLTSKPKSRQSSRGKLGPDKRYDDVGKILSTSGPGVGGYL